MANSYYKTTLVFHHGRITKKGNKNVATIFVSGFRGVLPKVEPDFQVFNREELYISQVSQDSTFQSNITVAKWKTLNTGHSSFTLGVTNNTMINILFSNLSMHGAHPTIISRVFETAGKYVYLDHENSIGRVNQTNELQRRISLGWADLGQLQNGLKNNPIRSRNSPTDKGNHSKITGRRRMERAMIGVSLRDRVLNEDLRRRTGVLDNRTNYKAEMGRGLWEFLPDVSSTTAVNIIKGDEAKTVKIARRQQRRMMSKYSPLASAVPEGLGITNTLDTSGCRSCAKPFGHNTCFGNISNAQVTIGLPRPNEDFG
ncbi:hypothetical protein HUJ05_002171 [Dendroctonus ponderosae]|nr:hypothetical protein HUJ05_002171 [Dendroctonus ponderosae]